MKKDEGFSFIEILASLAIMLTLSATVAVSAVKYIEKARRTAAITQIDAFKAALQVYRLDCGRYPTKEQGLQALWEKPYLSPVPSGWNGPYVDSEIGADPWGGAYIYMVPGEHDLAYSIKSLGADGEEGGEGNDADVVSWKR